MASTAIPGGCPSGLESNKDAAAVNQTQLGGLWYEYLHTPGYLGQSDEYECATWNMLASTPNPNVTGFSYEVLHHGLNQTMNKTFFDIRKLICGEPNTTDALACEYY